jgi:hypothetical protein
MAEDVETPAAASSPAEPQQTDIAIPTDPEAYAEWRQTGKLPDEPKPKKREAPAASKPSVDEESSESGAPVSETGKSGRSAEQRIKQLVSERDTYRARAEALEAGKKDAPAESSPAPARHVSADSSTAPDASTGPVEPDQGDFDSWAAFKAAEKKYFQDLVTWGVKQEFQEERERQFREAQTREFQKLLDSAKERYGDEAESRIVSTAKQISNDDTLSKDLKTAIARSPVLVDAMYVMGSDEKEFSGFLDLAKKDPLEALRKWFTVEELVKQELGTASAKSAAPQHGPDGKFLPPDKPARKFPPAPPIELNGNSSPPGDQSESAAASGNFRAFSSERNRKDLLRHKGQI